MENFSLNLSLINQLSTLRILIHLIKVIFSLKLDSYLQSVNFDNNVKKYRFWKNIVSTVPKNQ